MRLNKELEKSLETQLQLETRVQGLEEEQVQLMEGAAEKEKELKDQEKRLQEELQTQVDATTAAGIAQFEDIGRHLETLTQGHQTQMEDMEKQLQQSQIEIQTLRGGVSQAVKMDQDGSSGANSEQEHEILAQCKDSVVKSGRWKLGLKRRRAGDARIVRSQRQRSTIW